MTDREAFIAAIVANPEDDTVRLVFADWLEEHGEPERAEFVRVQVELARLPECPCCADGGVWASSDDFGDTFSCHCRGTVLRARERELLQDREHAPYGWGTCEAGWAKECTNFVTEDNPHGTAYTFRRGFVESITCTAADWLAFADAITAAHPVRKVTLTTESGLPMKHVGGNVWTCDRFPGIEFELPPLTGTG